jgi:hypothetical protein
MGKKLLSWTVQRMEVLRGSKMAGGEQGHWKERGWWQKNATLESMDLACGIKLKV